MLTLHAITPDSHPVRRNSLLGTLLLGSLLFGCADVETVDLEDEPDTLAIQGGAIETGLPAVGKVDKENQNCTGTLISPNYVVTARHCVGFDNTFSLGNGPTFAPENVYAADGYTWGVGDLAVIHLARPVTTVTPLGFSAATLKVGQECRAVGFGRHDENGEEIFDIKRSATVYIERIAADEIIVKRGTGIADHVDSGGPLLCDGKIVGVVKNHDGFGESPDHQFSRYTPAEFPYITKATKGEVTLPKPSTPAPSRPRWPWLPRSK